MARAHVMRPVTGEDGDLLYGAQILVRESGLSVRLAQPLYASATGTEQLPNPYVSASGTIDFWLEEPQRVSVLVTHEQHSDILVYLDAHPAPEETVRSESDLVIVGDQVPGNVLMAGSTPGQAVWGALTVSTGVSPLVTVLNETFARGQDPAGWTFTAAPGTTRSYAAAAPDGQGLAMSLYAAHTAAQGLLAVATPAFTFTEPGFVSLWMRPSLASGESITFSATPQGKAPVVLETVTDSRPWGFYRYPLAAGTYSAFTVTFSGAAFAAGAGHEMWVTGVRLSYGGQVPAHTHSGSGASSVLLGSSATASGAGAVAVGDTSVASGVRATAVGYAAQAAGAGATALGVQASAAADSTTAVGARAKGDLSAAGWSAFGADSQATAINATAVGAKARASAADGLAVGYSAYVGESGQGAIALGSGAQATQTGAVAVGAGAVASHPSAVALGPRAVTTAMQQISLGAADLAYTAVVVNGRLYVPGQANIGLDATTRVGFFGVEGTVQPVVTGSDGGVLALRNLLNAFHGLGLIFNQTTG